MKPIRRFVADRLLARLEHALERGDRARIMLVLRELIYAQGGFQAVADAAGRDRTGLYQTMRIAGNPSLGLLLDLLGAFDLTLSVKRKQSEAALLQSFSEHGKVVVYYPTRRGNHDEVTQDSAGDSVAAGGE